MSAWFRASFAVCVLLAASGAAASEPTGPAGKGTGEVPLLQLSEVLDSVDEHHPLVQAELQAVRAARGGVMQARGAFDPKLRLDAEIIPQGYYDYGAADASVWQQTPWLGSEFYAGYRYQRGSLPDYVGELETLSRGELRAGVRLPLWKDRQVDDARAQRTQSQAMLAGAKAGLGDVRLHLWMEASAAYYEWVAAAESLRVSRELLDLAQRRASQIAGKVRSGALAPFAELDNQRALLSRQAKLVMARRKLEKARLKLSLFWRDSAGRPLLAEDHQPPTLSPPEGVDGVGGLEAQALAVERHPERGRAAMGSDGVRGRGRPSTSPGRSPGGGLAIRRRPWRRTSSPGSRGGRRRAIRLRRG